MVSTAPTKISHIAFQELLDKTMGLKPLTSLIYHLPPLHLLPTSSSPHLLSCTCSPLTLHLHLLPPSTCLVTAPRSLLPSSSTSTVAFINPANRSLAGAALPYFPRGGPVPRPPPPGVQSSQWGGMEAGPGMLYPSQVCDGVVHSLGGRHLRHLLLAAARRREEEGEEEEEGEYLHGEDLTAPSLCPVGGAVVTD